MSSPSAKQGLLSLQIKDKKELYSAYMPYVKGGAIFVPTPKRYQLGDEIRTKIEATLAGMLDSETPTHTM